MDGVDPQFVPHRTLPNGARMPAIGLGTFHHHRTAPDEIAAAVRGAAEVGYRHFDCAAIYGNESAIGAALSDILAAGVRREDLWITSKLWNACHGEDDVIPACRKTLADLRVDYLDLYLVHWPFPNYTAHGRLPGPEARPYLHAEYVRTWRKMEQLVDLGLVRHIGTSNMTIPKLRLVLQDARIRPAAEQLEMHPHFQQPEMFRFLGGHGIQAIGYCPIGAPCRPEHDRSPEDTSPLEDPVIVGIAHRIGVHPAVVCVKWAIQRGQTPIPFSTNRAHYLANLQSTISAPLPDEDMRALAAIDRNCRLIKGHQLVWKAGQSWRDLWDSEGGITPA